MITTRPRRRERIVARHRATSLAVFPMRSSAAPPDGAAAILPMQSDSDPRPDTVSWIFDALTRWRHLPTYQLERRLDVFIAPYLLDFLRASGIPGIADVEWLPGVLPEFPLPIATLIGRGYPAPRPRSSDPETPRSIGALKKSADYAVFGSVHPTVLLVELKTDSASVVPNQIDYLLAARRCGFGELLAGLKPILHQTKPRHRGKYEHLLRELHQLGALAPLDPLDHGHHEIETPLSHAAMMARTKQYRRRIDELAATTRFTAFEVAYLLPTRSSVLADAGIPQIPFDEVSAAALEPAVARGDLVARRLLELLPQLGTPAGARL